MRDLSILIPSRNEMFLAKTIENLLENIEADTEIIAVLDGQWAEPPVPDHPRVTLVYLPESIGQRAATNLACRLSSAKYVMKLDAHCAVDKGFDRKMIAEMRDDWTMIPMMYNLHAFDWVCPNGHRRYQGKSGPCNECGAETKRDLVWQPRLDHCTWSWYFDKDLHFQYLGGAHRTPKEKDVVETMSLLGACFMLTREKYWELDICDEKHGSWGQQGTEVACKTWLSGGKLMVNRKTWFSHMFRTQGGDFGFPYPISNQDVSVARNYSRELWFDGKWDKAKHDLKWLINKFNPPTWNNRKGIVYYTDNRLKWSIAQEVRKQLKSIGLSIVSVSRKPAGLGKNIVLKGEPGPQQMFRQILKGLEKIEAEIIFLCEHDVLYHPSHFDFVPPEKDKFYFNTNVWKVDFATGRAITYDALVQLSGMVAYKETLIKWVKSKIEKFDRHFEPLKDREVFRSAESNIDIRHSNNLTPNRWSIDQFRKKPTGWTEGECPNWAKEKLLAMKDKVWIASFPRSGNHRCRQVIYNLLFDRQANRKELDKLEDLGYLKTHFTGDKIEGKAIYLIRNEEDVVSSVSRFFPFTKGDAARSRAYVQEGYMAKWRNEPIGNREENIKSYQERPDTLILHYEDFSQEQIRQIAEFCGLKGDYQKIYEWNIGEKSKYIDIDSGMQPVITNESQFAAEAA